MSAIHPTALVEGDVAPGCIIGPYAVIHPGVKLMPGVIIGAHCVIGPGAIIGEKTEIGPHTVITGKVRIGTDCRISNHTSIGTPPQHVDPKQKNGIVIIGDRVTLREFSTVHMPAMEERTSIGDDCYIMSYCHIAHDVEVGAHVTMANNATLAGHVKVEACATLGLHVVVHQHLRVGAYSMIGMNATVTKNVWPYSTVIGERFAKINEAGLRRHGLETDLPQIEAAYAALGGDVRKAEISGNPAIAAFYRAAKVPKFYIPPQHMAPGVDNE